MCQDARLGRSIPSPDATLGDGDGAARHPYHGLIEVRLVCQVRFHMYQRADFTRGRVDVKFSRKYRGQELEVSRLNLGGCDVEIFLRFFRLKPVDGVGSGR